MCRRLFSFCRIFAEIPSFNQPSPKAEGAVVKHDSLTRADSARRLFERDPHTAILLRIDPTV